MSHAPGTRLGHYHLLTPLGAGGMGEVYRATDTTLGRDVAIKVLPGAFASDPERLGRFEREARVLAALNHAGIAHLYGFERATLPDGRSVHFLAMELVEGEDLADRLKHGPVSLDEALPIARQIAEALEAAHAQGIVHRDLKPANVKVRADGAVKVLDFGLAKAMDPGGGSSPNASPATSPAVMNSPTLTAAHGTQLGMILGTAAYMAPEQARGGAVDKRADIWAFGVVLYEMLAGRSLFAAATVTDTLAGVLKTEIDFSLLPKSTPPAIRRLLRRSLERHPKRRLHDIGDARVVIEDVLSGADTEVEGPPSADAASRSRRASLGWLAALVVVGVTAAVAGYVARGRSGEPVEPLRLSIQLASNQEMVNGANAMLAFAPDGTSLVFTARESGRQSLFRRSMGEQAATVIPGTDGGDGVFFAPDGRWIGFVSGGRMMKVPAEGGRPFPLADVRGTGGATWLHDNTIVFAPVYSDGLFRVSADGGTPERLTTPDRAGGELGHWWPDALPGERKVVFTAFHTPVDSSRIGIVDLQTREVRWLVDGGFFARYVPTGHLLYVKGKRLYALPFDPTTGTATGPAVAVLDDLNVSQTSGSAQFAVSRRGTLAYTTDSSGNPPSELAWIDRQGAVTKASLERRRFLSASLSPDDREAAVTILDESRDLWTYVFERGTLSRLTTGEGTEFNPIWSRDGRQLLYIVDRPPFDLYRIALGAPDAGRPIWDDATKVDLLSPALSPDGRYVAYVRSDEQTGNNIYVRPIDGREPPRAVRATRSEETYPSFSPDGRWLVYQSNENGRSEIYVEPFPGPGERIQISADGGTEPLWARNGAIFFRHYDETRVVPVRLGNRFEFDPPRTLFSFPIVPGGAHDTRTYDVTADGARVLAVAIPEASRPRQIEIVTDWTRRLEQLAPGRKR